MRTRRSGIAALVILLALATPNPVRAQANWYGVYGFDAMSFKGWGNQLAKEVRIVYFNVFDEGNWPQYNALATIQIRGPRSELETDLTAEQFDKQDKAWRAKGFYPTCVTGYLKDKVPHFGAIWVADRKRSGHVASINLQAQALFEMIGNDKKNRNYLPEIISGYADGNGSYRFAVLRVPAGKAVWDAQLDLTEAMYEKALEDGKAKGFRPMSVTVYPTPNGTRFAVVFIKDNLAYRETHRLSWKEHHEEYLRMRKAGFVPVSVTGYVEGRSAQPFEPLAKYMTERQMTFGTLVISRNGKPYHYGGLDLSDASRPRLPGVDIPMRLADATRAITAAAIHTLSREGKLSLDTRVFPWLGLKPPPGQKPDPRLNDITIRHLLEHKGGWDSTQTFDPLLRPLEIAAALKAPAPAGAVDIIRYMIGQPLQFDPGSRVCVSNFGYCVLGRVIEKASGQTYVGYVQKNIFAPLGAKSVELARTLPKFRNPREPRYLALGKGRNVLDPESNDEVPAPDGTFYLEAMDSACGLIASSRDMIRFLDAYGISGERRAGTVTPGTLFGNRPGTLCVLMQRPDGLSMAACFNHGIRPGSSTPKIGDLLQEIVDRQTDNGVRYAAVWVKNR